MTLMTYGLDTLRSCCTQAYICLYFNPPVATTEISLSWVFRRKRLVKHWSTHFCLSTPPPALDLLHLTAKGSYQFHGQKRFLSTKVTAGACTHVLFLIALINYSMPWTQTCIQTVSCALIRPRTSCVSLTHRCLHSSAPQPAAEMAQRSAQHVSAAWISITTITASCKNVSELKPDVMWPWV